MEINWLVIKKEIKLETQKIFRVGYHYRPTPEEAMQGLALLEGLQYECPPVKTVQYPDLRLITITD